MKPNLFIGAISGTSMDALDIALVDFANDHPNLVATLSYPIPAVFRERCLTISQSGQCSIDDIGMLDVAAGSLFADAILVLLKEQNLSSNAIRAIGSHGQNLRHRPDLSPPFTLQIGDPNTIAERTGIPTIADFRRRDIAAGGQGAPLAPAFHKEVLGSVEEDRVIINIGGISNITFLSRDPKKSVTGYDTGPGNCLMDAWVQKHLNIPFDKDAEFARQGTPNNALLDALLKDRYFDLEPPKSTGREYFNLDWLQQKMQLVHIELGSAITAADIQATLLKLTSRVIKDGIRKFKAEAASVFVCGGGAHNALLIDTLSQDLKSKVQSTEILGVHPDWVEAMLFAWLAKQTLEGKAGNFPTVTGARNAVILGGIFGFRPEIIR